MALGQQNSSMTSKEIAEQLEKTIDTSTQALIFDLDGTLVDSNPAHLAAWTEACTKYGLTYPKEKFFFFAGLPSTKIAAMILELHPDSSQAINPDRVAAEKEHAFEKYQTLIKPIEPVVALLKKYHGKLPTALGTGRIRTSTMRTLEVLGLTGYLDTVVTADDVTAYKPAPDTFLKCADILKVDPAHCIVFEDAERGIDAGKNAGMNVVNVRHWLGPEVL